MSSDSICNECQVLTACCFLSFGFSCSFFLSISPCWLIISLASINRVFQSWSISKVQAHVGATSNKPSIQLRMSRRRRHPRTIIIFSRYIKSKTSSRCTSFQLPGITFMSISKLDTLQFVGVCCKLLHWCRSCIAWRISSHERHSPEHSPNSRPHFLPQP